jgi:hypothetical protein
MSAVRDSVSAVDADSRRQRAVVLALHAMSFAALLAWSWRKWPDPIVDFGRELYMPWQITQGRVLFRDIASLFGPFSPYLNALWFSLFGTSLMTLALCNLAILVATSGGIYHLLRVSTDRVTACAATLTCVLLFGFAQYLDVGNYNFITPYSHEATHGLALSVAALICLHHAFASRRPRMAGASGVCSGLVLLTKPEIALALGLALVIGFFYTWTSARIDRRLARTAVAFSAGALVPPIGFLLYFHLGARMPLHDSGQAIAAGWISALATSIARNRFYAKVTGFDHPVDHFLRMLQTFAGFLMTLAVGVAMARWNPVGRLSRAAALILRTVFLLAIAYAVPYFELSRAFPLIAASGFAAAVITARRERSERRETLPHLPLIMWSAFALAMLAKMFLNAQIYHYGFYLALPATSVAVVVLLWFVPLIVAARLGDAVAGRARWLFASAIAVAIAPHIALSQAWFSTKTVSVGSGGDRFLAGSGPRIWQGEAVDAAQRWIEGQTPRGTTISVVPEGVMINYLSRRPTPLRFVNFMPPEVIAFGEDAIVRDFGEHPPDFILLVNRSTAEYGYAFFGGHAEYGQATMSWIRAHYDPVAEVGRDPTSESGRAIVVLKRRR